MPYDLVDHNEIEAFFGKNTLNQPLITFQDPSYVRAETIIFEAATRYVHAILHEKAYFLGQIPEELGATFKSKGSITLAADHYAGKPVQLTAQLSVA